MKKTEYRRCIDAAGLSQVKASEFFEVSRKTSPRWARGESGSSTQPLRSRVPVPAWSTEWSCSPTCCIPTVPRRRRESASSPSRSPRERPQLARASGQGYARHRGDGADDGLPPRSTLTKTKV